MTWRTISAVLHAKTLDPIQDLFSRITTLRFRAHS